MPSSGSSEDALADLVSTFKNRFSLPADEEADQARVFV
jgi:hypothetical protein